MKIYTLTEASRVTQIPVETLKRACDEGLINASKLPNREWRIAESALEEALHEGIKFTPPAKRTGKKQPQPIQLRRAQEAKKNKKAA